MKKILVINGPNLNLLSNRASNHYSNFSYKELEDFIKKKAADFGIEANCKQSNNEGEIIDWIQSYNDFDAIIINPGGYTHSSVAIHDALEICTKPKIEVHLSNILNREEFRTTSITSKACNGSILGLGILGYELALQAAINLIN